ncbi:MAG: NAD(P)-dependent oxidoreductase [Clostridia bacterium]
MKQRVWTNLYDDLIAETLLNGLQQSGFEVVRKHVDKSDRAALLKTVAEGYDYVVASLEQWDSELIDAAGDQLKALVKYGTGINNFDIPYATQKGIAIANLAGQNAQTVAQLAMTHILSSLRGFDRACAYSRESRWKPHTGMELDGKTVGLVGFGQIAQHLSRMLEGFWVSVIAYDVFENKDALAKHQNVIFTNDLNELLEKSDVVSLHVPLLPETQGMMDCSRFARMKNGAILVNTSRGEIVNEPDLMEALRSGKLMAAGLDVMSAEPFDPNNPLLKMDNVSVTPHIGAASFESEERCQHLMVEIIKTFAEGQIHNRIINPTFAQQRR